MIKFLWFDSGYELEVMGNVRNLSPTLWTLSQLTVLYLNDNQLTRLPSEIACLNHLVTLDISNNKLRNLPSEIGDLITLRELNLTNNSIRNLPYEIGKLFRLQSLGNSLSLLYNQSNLIYSIGLLGNPLPGEIFALYTESNGLQKLLTYFLDNYSSSLNGIKQKRIFFFDRHELCFFPSALIYFENIGSRFSFIIIFIQQYDTKQIQLQILINLPNR